MMNENINLWVIYFIIFSLIYKKTSFNMLPKYDVLFHAGSNIFTGRPQ